ncbi:MAG: acyl-CoA dehydrogenase family protein [Planctomycetes bacterium]|nr:acyl-CoA dehydrogenase family protein [Planctomycetota bacterium]
MDFDLPDELIALRDMARRFAAEEIAPHARQWDREADIPRELVSKLAKAGFLGIFIPTEQGGAGLGDLGATVVMEEIARHCGATALMLDAHNALCSAHLAIAANDKQKAKYLPALASGEYLGAWALSEPGCGSDAAALTTTAELQGDSWVLNGAKQWITNGHYAGVYVVMAQTKPEGGSNGISAFIVERNTTGLTIGPKEDKLGMRGSDTVGLMFENMRIPKENLCGELHGGFVDAMKALGDAAIQTIDLEKPATRRVENLMECLDAIPDHEQLHQVLEATCREAMLETNDESSTPKASLI